MKLSINKIITLIAVSSVLGLAGCDKQQSPVIRNDMEEWLKNADLEAEETPEELYLKALKEDTLVVYSISTRIYDVKESFEAAYPGLTVDIYDSRANDMIPSLAEAFEKQEYKWDVVLCSDCDGQMSRYLLPDHIVNKYTPYDIKPVLRDGGEGPLLSYVYECEQLFYNNEVYDCCPISNWWELTEPQWNGKVYMNSPLRSQPSYTLLYSVISNSDKMAAAYEDLYGEPLIVPEGSSAGKIFWERLASNGLQFTTSSNEIVEIIGAPGQSDPPLGFMISSKLRRAAIGMKIAPAYGTVPCDGIPVSSTVSIAGGSPNVNTAKLFIRWLMGETDGTGEGLMPYLQAGTWSARTDVPDNAPFSLEEGNFWFYDFDDLSGRYDELMEFWTELQGSITEDTIEEN